MFSKWISDIFNLLKLISYERKFLKLKKKYFNEVHLNKREKIKTEISLLLSLVQKIGKRGEILETEISNFLQIKRVIRIDPSMLQRVIEEREKNVVITIHPRHIPGSALAGTIKRREGSTFSTMSTLRKSKREKSKFDVSKYERKVD